MSSDIKEELAFKVIQFIGPEAEHLHSSSQRAVRLLSIKCDTVCTQSLVECYAADANMDQINLR